MMLNLATPYPGFPGAFIAQSAGNDYVNACSAAFGYSNGTSSSSDGIMVVGAVGAAGMAATPTNGGFANDFPAFSGPQPILSGSNYGPCVEVWAPGKNILSTYSPIAYDANNPSSWQSSSYISYNYVNLSGTSMAAPHIAGVAAYLAETQGLNSPAAIEAAVRNRFYSLNGMNMVTLP